MIKNFFFKQFSLAEVKDKWFQLLLSITNIGLFIYTLLNDQFFLNNSI